MPTANIAQEPSALPPKGGTDVENVSVTGIKYPVKPTNRSNKKKWIIITAVLVFLAAALAIGLGLGFGLSSSSSDDKSTYTGLFPLTDR